MISKKNVSECYVYITLPGHTDPITAGRLEITTHANGIALGRFVYGKQYLAHAERVEFDPVELRLANITYETTHMRGMFGVIRDAGPDYWGRRVIERHVGKPQLSELDYLLHSPDDRAGALSFGLNQKPPSPMRKFNQTIDLEKLQKIADSITADEDLPINEATAQVAELLLVGTSMGGARPKVVVEDHDGLWLAKFNRSDDPWNNARVEHAMGNLARACGINSAESLVSSIGGRDTLLVKRFDREKTANGYYRSRMVSGLTLLRAQDTYQSKDSWSYLLLVEEMRRISARPQQDAVELFKRMCFNALISNTDDHPRNHAILAKDRNWGLSPAYDLTPSTPISLERRELAMSIGDAGRFANAENILSQCQRFLMPRDDAVEIIKKMEKQIAKSWYKTARAAGVSERHCELISGAFCYPGFRL